MDKLMPAKAGGQWDDSKGFLAEFAEAEKTLVVAEELEVNPDTIFTDGAWTKN